MYNIPIADKQNVTIGMNHKANILIVDDDRAVRELLMLILETEGFSCNTAEDADKAMSIISEKRIDLVISDVIMPGKSGIQLLGEIKKNYPEIAALMITGNSNRKTAEDAISMGAYGYLYKPFQKQQVLISISDALQRRSAHRQNEFKFESLKHVIDDQSQNLTLANNRLEKMLKEVIKAMSLAIESRDPYTAGHQLRVMDLAMAIAAKLNFSVQSIEYLGMAAIIHDIGKISVPPEILSKPTKLTPAEFNVMQNHPKTGYKILKEISFPYPLAKIIYQHHERIDGSGYPQGLSGDQIQIEARILAVADVTEAIASHRPYRPSLGIDVALEEISKHKGVFFDPSVVDACCDIIDKKELTL